MENLITLLLHLVQKVPYLSEVEHDAEMDLLRAVESHLGVSGIVPPATGATNPPASVPSVPVPGQVAETPVAETPPVTSETVAAAAGDVAGQPEATNAFAVGETATWDGSKWVPAAPVAVPPA